MSCQVNTNTSSALSKALRQCSQDIDHQIQYQSSGFFGKAILWIKDFVSHVFYPRGSVESQIQKIDDLVQGLIACELEESHVTTLDSIKSRIRRITGSQVENQVIEIEFLACKKIFSSAVIKQAVLKELNFQVDATYEECRTGEPAEEGIVDVAYVDAKAGFAYVADFTSHGKPKKQETVRKGFEAFNTFYENKLKEKTFANFEEVKSFVRDTIKEFELLDSSEQLSGTAYVLGQAVSIKGTSYLITAASGDCMIVVRRSDGTLEHTSADKDGFGLGDRNPQMNVFQLREGDEVFGFSDGIGDYLTKEQFQEVLAENKDRSRLLSELKKAIIALGEASSSKSGTGKALSGGEITTHDFKDHNRYDDICLFVFKTDDPEAPTDQNQEAASTDSDE